jgi:hypothetical protein
MPKDRSSRAQATALALLEQLSGKKLDWDDLSEEIKSKFGPYLEESSQKPETRMRETMEAIAANANLRWSADSPGGHPYAARLDGQLFNGRDRIAVVELEARNQKQVRGALLDLMTYPAAKKVLVIGASIVVRDPNETKKHIKEQVLPVLSQKLGINEEIGIFTERELKESPRGLLSFLGMNVE